MHIKSIVIDGFKSYAQRTEVNGFDVQFNAITGLNGSGKSNILDAICFLLGITNLSQVRAGNLQDLVYKSGQAGVTKATVSIVFENKIKGQSPFGYEHFDELTITRQIVLGGRNKYLINGTNATNTRVQDLFRSVQLNVNNPHFLIMQGRITKVLNMKPPEILSLLEEAASTTLYENKKDNALKIILKKDCKLKEIDRVLKEDINPTLAKLRQERSSYLEYQKIVREIEHLKKFCTAYRYKCLEDVKQKTKEDLEEMKRTLHADERKIVELTSRKEELEREITDLCHERDNQQGGALQELENEVTEIQKREAVMSGALKRSKEAVKAATKARDSVHKQLTDGEKQIKENRDQLQALHKGYDELKKRALGDETELTAAQKHMQAVSSGLASNEDGEAATLEEQLRTATEEATNADIEVRQAEMRLAHLNKEVANKKAELKRTNQNFGQEETTRKQLVTEIASLEREMERIGYSEEKDEELTGEQLDLSRQSRDLRYKRDEAASRHPNLMFDFTNPDARFDRSRVKGLVGRLITLKDKQFATALEVTAGGKLYNVIVDSEQTAKLLLQRGQLARRVTFLPLNKMQGYPIPDQVFRKAEELVGRGKVYTALSLVNFAPELRPAMEYVLGNTLVCADLDTAKKLAFHPGIEKRTVTLDGDVFDPQGTLSGGSRNQSASVLLSVSGLAEAETALAECMTRLTAVEAQLAGMRRAGERWGELKRKLQETTQRLEAIDMRIQHTDFHRLSRDIEETQKEIEELRKAMEGARGRHTKAQKKATSVEDKLKNAAAVREKEMKDAETRLSTAKKRVEASSAALRQDETRVDELTLEIEEMVKEVDVLRTQMEEALATIKVAEGEVTTKTAEAAEAKTSLEEARERLEAHRSLLRRKGKEIAGKETELKVVSNEAAQIELNADQLRHKISMQIRESKDVVQKLDALLQANPWIPEEKKHFGHPNTAYDFSVQDPKEAQQRIDKLSERRDKLSQTVNMRAMNMLGSAEEQYGELVRRQDIVLSDKLKIQSTIDEMDKKKNEVLMEAYQKVNKEFCSIFSTVLPGTKAQLSPPEGQTVLQGLEFRVAFGDVWKESLSELSGGQRSLVALSLILALLKFNPAPLYILDEVDAALDLSHTQNIGQLIKQHFPQSQFIVVSLKDGMFNNANVLFKTKFIDGVSAVSRHVPSQPRPTGFEVALPKQDERKRKRTD